MTLSEDPAASSAAALSLFDINLSEASVIWRVTSDADFKLAAAGSVAIEIVWLGERVFSWPEGAEKKEAASPTPPDPPRSSKFDD